LSGLECIKEVAFPVGTLPGVEALLESWFLENLVEVYCIYADHGGRLELVACSGTRVSGKVVPPADAGPEYHTRFAEFLRREKPQSFGDVLFLLTAYRDVMNKWGEPDTAPAAERLTGRWADAVEWFLAPSRGRIAWQHQMENILGIFYPDVARRREIRGNLNKKMAETQEELREIRLSDEYSLMDFIDERTLPSGCTVPMNVQGAGVLWAVISAGAE
jgi:hypothetical protein